MNKTVPTVPPAQSARSRSFSAPLARQRWRRRPHWLVLCLGVGAIGIPLFGLRALVRPVPLPETVTPAAPERVAVVALGRIEPASGVINVGLAPGDIVESLVVSQGDWVAANQPIAYLKGYQTQLVQQALIAEQLAEAKRQVATGLDYQRSQIEAVSTDLGTIEAPFLEQIAAQNALIEKQRSELAQAQLELQRQRQLFAAGAVARQQAEQQQLQVTQIQRDIQQAIAALDRIDADRSRALRNTASQVQIAQADLARVEGQSPIGSLTQQLALAEAQQEQFIVRAPQAGRVLQVLTQAGETVADLTTGATLLQLGDVRRMVAIAEVDQADIRRVKVGQAVTVTSRDDAFAEPIEGTVESIGEQIFKNGLLDDDPTARNDTRVIEVTVNLNQSKPVSALTNLQVDVRIGLETPPNAAL